MLKNITKLTFVVTLNFIGSEALTGFFFFLGAAAGGGDTAVSLFSSTDGLSFPPSSLSNVLSASSSDGFGTGSALCRYNCE